MRFFLMQRNHQVAVIEIAEKTGDIIDVAEVLSAQRIPLGAKHSDGNDMAMAALMFCPCANGGQGAVSRQAVPGWSAPWKRCISLTLNFCLSNAAG